MRYLTASFIAMSAGWFVMNLVVVLWLLYENNWSAPSALGFNYIFAFASAIVVAGAWLIFYLPAYLYFGKGLNPPGWRGGLGVGLVIGFFVAMFLPLFFGASIEGAFVMGGLGAIVGAVSGGVGGYLLDWCDGYEAARWRERLKRKIEEDQIRRDERRPIQGNEGGSEFPNGKLNNKNEKNE